MKKFLATILAAFFCLTGMLRAEVAVTGQWRIHNTFDYYFSETIDTPERVYLLAMGQQKRAEGIWAAASGQLFVLDKKSGEMTGYNAGNYLTGNVISDIAYNAAGGYLLIVYDNYNIDILTDDDKLYTIPGLASATLSTSKNINSINFDRERNKAYLATDFGYIVIDDKKKIISESRVYNTKLNAVARVGDTLLIGKEDGLFAASAEDRNSSLSDFKRVGGYSKDVTSLLPLDDTKFGMVGSEGLFIATLNDNAAADFNKIDEQVPEYYSENRDGYFARYYGCLYQLLRDGTYKRIYIYNTDFPSDRCGTWDWKTFYIPRSREGLLALVYTDKFSDSGKMYYPNAPEPYGAFGFAWSDNAGMLVSNAAYNRFYSYEGANYPSLISSYDRGEWTTRGRTASKSAVVSSLTESTPVVADPIDPNYYWVGSRQHGLARFDLRDGSAELYSQPNHDKKGEPGFHAVFPFSEGWTKLCTVSSPSFDSQGNLWCVFNPSHADAFGPQPVFCWKASDRRAGNVSAFKNVPVKGYAKHYDNLICTATKTDMSRNFLVFGPSFAYHSPLYLFYHAGTIDDTSDDKLLSYSNFVDQDGNGVPYIYFNAFYEDPSTGYIWVCTDAGVFYFNPNDALRNDAGGGTLHVRRVKVARNDGTNLADYLLDGYDVTCVAADGASRKWFGTMGGGVLVTSADGSKVLERFTASNSELPSDNIYGIGFDPTGNAVWIGTSKQITTYFCDATPAEPDYSNVLAFPNPVRPEHPGPVTIKGLMDNSLVKIADASGSVIKELGFSNGGMAIWDLTDMQGRQVGAGVYYILSSTTSESDEAKGNTTKILVIR
ncbi:MAG: hypothetical protein NC402_03855 [Prevotella sp.]|nr:hypothetical protein [Prevotella sp.]MCM1074883.1 hypothetical protein [Ruminococcus sp.]